MKRLCILSLAIALPACSGDDAKPNNAGETDSSFTDTSAQEAGGEDVTTQEDTGADGGPAHDGGPVADSAPLSDGPVADASDGATPETDASDGGCPATWYVAPVVDPKIAVADGGGRVLLHATGTGTQNYVCASSTGADGGPSYGYTLVTPVATLSDCHAATIGHHFASEAGAGFPEWQTTDGTYVIGQKKASFDGGAESIPWLLINAVDAGGSGTLSQTAHIQRLDTDGGNAPAGCDGAHVGDTVNVPYTADYYFFGD